MSRLQDNQIEREWTRIQRQLSPGETAAGRVLGNMATMRAGLHRVRNDKGQYAYFPDVPVLPGDSPEQRALEDSWEADSISMHAAQAPLGALDPKIAEDYMAGRGNFILKITPNTPDPGIPKFEDSAESAALRRAPRTASDTLPSGKRELKRT